ncbi:peptidylprolyl isomerase [Planococcus halocryophilus]|uniref:peptidylprolyl isomerase n=1 Tax=Planococcus halocryophilus TaxID=1215089 RepID=UPI001F1168E6|nr:peptidylprolyl isomerase [Planococcus halocryophilus]MCH4827956.1 peptidylprolyl isomerase [Planococcus halocryophilus]
MKKLLVLVFISALLSGCNSFDSSPSIEKLEATPKDVQEVIELVDPTSSLSLQAVTKKGNITYVIYQSTDSVTASLEKQGDKLNIKLVTKPKDSNDIEQHVFELIGDEETETIDVLVNGESTPLAMHAGL